MKKIDKRKKYFLVLDTETFYLTNKDVEGMVYDLGYVIVDKKGVIYEKGSYLIKELYNPYLISLKKALIYQAWLKSGDIEKISLKKLIKKLNSLMEKYRISECWAYNCTFDKRHLNYTCEKLDLPCLDVVWCDIMMYTKQTIYKQKNFDSFCEKYNFKTKGDKKKSQNKWSAETVYRYISNNPYFCELHTGYEDVLLEYKILNKCIRQHKKVDKSTIYKF